MLTYSINDPAQQKAQVLKTADNTVQLIDNNGKYFGNVIYIDGKMQVLSCNNHLPVSLAMVPALADMITVAKDMLDIPNNISNKKIDFKNYGSINLWAVVNQAIDYGRVKNARHFHPGK